MGERIDKELVERGLVTTRSQAQSLINQSMVKCNGQLVTKPSLKVSSTDLIELEADKLYVSRGAFKLKKAIEVFGLSLEDKIVADIGSSTGGFTQVSLEYGAKKVYAIDVGTEQLHPLLKEDQRVVSMENTNIKDVTSLPEKVDFCVSDLSFISITKVFKNMASLLNEKGLAVLLIKPQFEAGRERMGKGGLVPEKFLNSILDEVEQWFVENSYKVIKKDISPIRGNKSGNTEYLWLVEV